ncbi:MAG: heme-copper oxidase subunit III [Elusimicrobia bacterium]|nr:heme-copper oxidase subunit III [Elusimicrobiota bacterium]
MSSTAHAEHLQEPVTGIPNGKLGIWLFLASEVMLFSTLFTTYIILRVAAPEWPRGWEVLNVPLAMTNTFVLITSSVTMVLAYAKAVTREKAAFNKYLGLTIALGFVFLGIKAIEYGAKFEHRIAPSTSIFYAIYFTTTGLHGLHVIGGIIANSVLLWLSNKQWDHPLFVGRIEYAGLYWHFVDIVWIFLFPALYLL